MQKVQLEEVKKALACFVGFFFLIPFLSVYLVDQNIFNKLLKKRTAN